jgi:small subunit ribosomal protein S6
MRTYEIMLAINPQLEDEGLNSLIDKVKKIITDAKGKIIKTDKWGKRKLAYEIKDFTEAIYVVLKFNLKESDIFKLERVLKFEERIIRYLLTLQEEKISSKKKLVKN